MKKDGAFFILNHKSYWICCVPVQPVKSKLLIDRSHVHVYLISTFRCCVLNVIRRNYSLFWFSNVHVQYKEVFIINVKLIYLSYAAIYWTTCDYCMWYIPFPFVDIIHIFKFHFHFNIKTCQRLIYIKDELQKKLFIIILIKGPNTYILLVKSNLHLIKRVYLV